MRDWKLLLCAALYLTLTALRFYFPGEAETARVWLADTVDPKRSCRAVALQLGRELDAFHPKEKLLAVFEQGKEALR